MKVTVLCGGLSHERDVSISSGVMVANALSQLGHKVTLLDTYFGNKIKSCEMSFKNVPSINELKRKKKSSMLFDKKIIRYCKKSDVVFLCMHGGMGENGQLQALLDCYGIKYTGASFLASAICMDKSITKTLLKEIGIPTPKGITVNKNEAFDLSDIPLPCVIKPCSDGSSVGVQFVNDINELNDGLNDMLKQYDKICIEEKIDGREITVGVLDDMALPPVEIVAKNGFYDYENKYTVGRTDEICPAQISQEESETVSAYAIKASKTLGCPYCRVDFILKDGVPYCLEVNTLPGMTQTSLLPLAANTVGITYQNLVMKIINLAEGRNDSRTI